MLTTRAGVGAAPPFAGHPVATASAPAVKTCTKPYRKAQTVEAP
jgi:hypothetical protein